MPISVDVSGLVKAGKALDDIDKAIRGAIKEGLNRIGEYAAQQATAGYSSAVNAGPDWAVDGLVTHEMIDDSSVRVQATGSQTLFIEFGTGVLNPDAPDARADLKEGAELVGHGEYGQGRGDSPLGWFYYGEVHSKVPLGTGHPYDSRLANKGLVHTYGQPAQPIMYEVKKELENGVAEKILIEAIDGR